MIGGVEEPALHERLRAVTLWPFTAWVLTQLYFTSIPLLPVGARRWLFEVVRVLLVAGAVGGVGGAAFVLLQHRARVGLHAAVWLLALAAGVLLCAWTFARMTFPRFA